MKMLTREPEQEQRQVIEMLCTDMLVPQDHLLRKVDTAVEFKHIYEAAHGKKPLGKDDDNDDNPKLPKEKTIIESTTDPESGLFHKGEHRKCFAYEAHTMCEKHGYVLEVEVTPGNVHDSVAFDTVFQKATEHYPEIEVVTADAGYKTPWICKQIIDSRRIPSLPYKRPTTKKGNLPWYEYVYDEYYDCILCPQYHVSIHNYVIPHTEIFNNFVK